MRPNCYNAESEEDIEFINAIRSVYGWLLVAKRCPDCGFERSLTSDTLECDK